MAGNPLPPGWRAYVADSGDPSEFALIVFARSIREAKPLAYRALCGLAWVPYIEMHVRWLRGATDYHADGSLLERGQPHVNESPEGCLRCERWYAAGLEMEGLCAGCIDELAEQREEWMMDEGWHPYEPDLDDSVSGPVCGADAPGVLGGKCGLTPAEHRRWRDELDARYNEEVA